MPVPKMQKSALMVWFALCLICLPLAECSPYKGPITNAPEASGSNGLPGLTHELAP